MSIIEKAVNALGKGGERAKTSDASADDAISAPDAVDTVQRSEKSIETEGHAAPADYELEQSSPIATATVAPVGSGHMVKIPFKELQALGMLTPSIPRSAIAEEYRTIKRPLLINIAGDSVTPPVPHGNLIMVTSALEGDGKTFTSICLALSIAMERDKHVLFVDADTAKAEAGRMLGVPSKSPGLIDVLENKSASAADYILPTNVEKLRILPAGGVHTHANELLASAKMQELMLELSREDPDRVIVFDSPPLLLTTEAAVLASFMGQIVFVVSADMTPQDAVTKAIEHIGEDKMVGMVLNRARRKANLYGQTYGYGGAYGHGHRDRESAPESGH